MAAVGLILRTGTEPIPCSPGEPARRCRDEVVNVWRSGTGRGYRFEAVLSRGDSIRASSRPWRPWPQEKRRCWSHGARTFPSASHTLAMIRLTQSAFYGSWRRAATASTPTQTGRLETSFVVSIVAAPLEQRLDSLAMCQRRRGSPETATSAVPSWHPL